MKNLIVSLLVIGAAWFVYKTWGTIPCLYFIMCSQFVLTGLYVGKNFEKISEQIAQIDLNTGRLRVRIESLEANVYGNHDARRLYDSTMHMNKEPDYTDPDAFEYYRKLRLRRDGFMPPIFNGYFGDKGLKYRLLEIEKKLGIENKSDSEEE